MLLGCDVFGFVNRRTDHSLDEVVADDANARMSFTLGKSDSWTAGTIHISPTQLS